MRKRNVGTGRSSLARAIKPVIENLEQRLFLSITAPSSLLASGSNTPGLATAIGLQWEDNSNNETSFKVERKTGSGGTWAQIGTANANDEIYNDGTVSAGTQYYYRVRASNDTEDSSYSNESDAIEWTSANIGSASGGSFSVSNGVATLVSNGNGMAGSSDNFRFAYRSLHGDGEIIAKVTSVQWTNPMARAAIMFRNSLASNSRSAFLAIMPNGSAQWSFRRTDGANAQQTNISNQAAPRYVKLVRFGSLITASVSANGTSWTQVGQANITMDENVYVGLALSASEYYGGYNTSTFEDVSVGADPHPLPAGWTSQDIGSAPMAGTSRFTDDTYIFTVEGSGQLVGGTSDSLHFAHRTLVGDGEIIAKVTSIVGMDGNPSGYNQYAMAGVMFRDGLAANARTALMAITGWDGARFQYRATTGGNSTEVKRAGITVPYYVRLVRSGNTFTGYISTDGSSSSSWGAAVGSVTISGMPSSLEVGLTFNAAAYGSLNTATFEAVKMIPAAPSSLAATPNHAHRIDLSWTDNSSSEDGFSIERRADGGAWQVATTVSGSNAWIDYGVQPGVEYDYRVRAYMTGVTGGNSDYSNIDAAHTTGLGDGLAATYWNNEDFTGTTATRVDEQLSFQWSNGESPAAGIEGSTFAAEWKGRIKAQTTDTYTFTTFADDGVRVWVNDQLVIDSWNIQSPTSASGTILLTADQKYNLRVEYFQNFQSGDLTLSWAVPGGVSVLVPTANLYSDTSLIPAAPAAPTNVTAFAPTNTKSFTPGFPDQPKVSVSWTAVSGAHRYNVYRTLDGGQTYEWVGTTNSTSISDTRSVVNGTNYQYRVVAVGPGGHSAPTEALLTPDVSVQVLSDSEVRLTWADINSDEEGYRIDRSDDNGVTWQTVAIVDANSTSYIDSGLEAGHSYLYRVSAVSSMVVSVPDVTPFAVPASVPEQLGVRSRFFARHDLSGAGYETVYPGIDFALDWGSGSPMKGKIAKGPFSAIFDTTFVAPAAGEYTFQVKANGGVRLFVDNTKVYDHWSDIPRLQADFNNDGAVNFFDLTTMAANYGGSNMSLAQGDANGDGAINFYDLTALSAIYGQSEGSVTETSSTISLQANQQYALRAEYFNLYGQAELTITAKLPGAEDFVPLSNIPVKVQPVPAAPTNLAATANSSSQITITWTDNSGGEDPPISETGFRIERKGGASAQWTDIAVVGANVTSYVDSNLRASTAYTYRVRAYNGGGLSGYSNEVGQSTLSSSSAQTLTWNTSVTVSKTDTTALLSWPVPDAALQVSYFEVYRNDQWVATRTSSNFLDTGLAASTSYTYQIKAFTASGAQSAPITVSVTTYPGPSTTAPTWAAGALSLSYSTSTRLLRLSWPAADSTTRYEIFRNGTFVRSTTSSLVDEAGLAAGTVSYSVIAVGINGVRSTPLNNSITIDDLQSTMTNFAPAQDVPKAWEDYFYDDLTLALRTRLDLLPNVSWGSGTVPAARHWYDGEQAIFAEPANPTQGTWSSLTGAPNVYYLDLDRNGHWSGRPDSTPNSWIGREPAWIDNSAAGLDMGVFTAGDTPLDVGMNIPIGASGIGNGFFWKDQNADTKAQLPELFQINPFFMKGTTGDLAYYDVNGDGKYGSITNGVWSPEPIWKEVGLDGVFGVNDTVVFDPTSLLTSTVRGNANVVAKHWGLEFYDANGDGLWTGASGGSPAEPIWQETSVPTLPGSSFQDLTRGATLPEAGLARASALSRFKQDIWAFYKAIETVAPQFHKTAAGSSIYDTWTTSGLIADSANSAGWTVTPSDSQRGIQTAYGSFQMDGLISPVNFAELRTALSKLVEMPALYGSAFYDQIASQAFVDAANLLLNQAAPLLGRDATTGKLLDSDAEAIRLYVAGGFANVGSRRDSAILENMRALIERIAGKVQKRDELNTANNKWATPWTKITTPAWTTISLNQIKNEHMSERRQAIDAVQANGLWIDALTEHGIGIGNIASSNLVLQQIAQPVTTAPGWLPTNAAHLDVLPIETVAAAGGVGEVWGKIVFGAGEIGSYYASGEIVNGVPEWNVVANGNAYGITGTLTLPSGSRGTHLAPFGAVSFGPDAAYGETAIRGNMGNVWGQQITFVDLTAAEVWQVLRNAQFSNDDTDNIYRDPTTGLNVRAGRTRSYTDGALTGSSASVVVDFELASTLYGLVNFSTDFAFATNGASIAIPAVPALPLGAELVSTTTLDYRNVIGDTDRDDLVDVGHDLSTFGKDTGLMAFQAERDSAQTYLPLFSYDYGTVPTHGYIVQGGFAAASGDPLLSEDLRNPYINEEGLPYAYSLNTRVRTNLYLKDSVNQIKRLEVVRPRGNAVVFDFPWNQAQNRFDSVGTPIGREAGRLYVLRQDSEGYHLQFPSGITHNFGTDGALLSVSNAAGQVQGLTVDASPYSRLNVQTSTAASDRYDAQLLWSSGHLTGARYTTRETNPSDRRSITTEIGYLSSSDPTARINALNKKDDQNSGAAIDPFSYQVNSQGTTITNGEVTFTRSGSVASQSTITRSMLGIDGWTSQRSAFNSNGLVTESEFTLDRGAEGSSSALTTINYQTDTARYANSAPKWGKVETITDPNGAWQRFAYDANTGWLVSTVTAFQDGLASDPDSVNQRTQFEYAEPDGAAAENSDTTHAWNLVERPRKVTQYVQNQVVGLSFNKFTGDTITTQMATADIAVWNSPANHWAQTTITGGATGASTVTKTLGRVASSSYSVGLSGRTISQSLSSPGATISSSTMTQTPFGYLKSLQASDMGVQVANVTTTPATAAGFGRIAQAHNALTGKNTAYGQFSWFGPNQILGEDLTETLLDRKSWGPVFRTTQNYVSTTYGFDADVNVAATTLASTTDPTFTLSAQARFDAQGRVIWSKDTTARETTTSYVVSGGALTVTTTLPDNKTLIDQYYRDGGLKSSGGTAAYPASYSSGVDAAKGYWVRSSSNAGQNWSKTYFNLLGQAHLVEKSGPNGAGNVMSATTEFDALGRAKKRTGFDGSIALTQYDEKYGYASDSILDVDQDGKYDGGVDRNTSYRRSVSTGGAWMLDGSIAPEHLLEITTVHGGSSPATPDTVSVARTGVNGLWSQQTGFGPLNEVIGATYGLTTKTETTLDAGEGQTTVRTRFADGTSQIQTFDKQLLKSVAQMETDGTTVITSQSFSYDPLRRGTSTASSFGSGTLVSTTNINKGTGQVDGITLAGGRTYAVTDRWARDGRATVIRRPDDRSTTLEFNDQGQSLSISGAGTFAQKFTYDSTNGQQTGLTTFSSGTLNGTGAATTTWSFNPFTGQFEDKTYPSQTPPPPPPPPPPTIETSYNNNGQVSRQTNGGVIADPIYNTVGEVDVYSSPGLTQTVLTRDAKGRIITSQRQADLPGSGSETYRSAVGYDANDRLASEESGVVSDTRVVYEYYAANDTAPTHSAGMPSTMKVMRGNTAIWQIDYLYDPATKRLNSIVAGGKTYTYGFKPGTNLVETLSSAGVVSSTLDYETATGRWNKLEQKKTGSGTHLFSSDWTFNLNTQKDRVNFTLSTLDASMGASSAWWEYTYDHDNADQLKTAQRKSQSGGQTFTSASYAYAYDGIGNRTDKAYAPNSANQYTVNPDAANAPITYDTRGNMTSDGIYTFTWNSAGQLVSGEPITITAMENETSDIKASRRVEFGYDDAGRRIWKKTYLYSMTDTGWVLSETRKFVYDGNNLVADFVVDPNGMDRLSRTYAWGKGIAGSVGGLLSITTFADDGATPTATYIPIYDDRGNVVGLVGASNGNLVATYQYDPWGKLLSEQGDKAILDASPFLYSTHYFERELQIYVKEGGVYSPMLGRRMNREPLGEGASTNLNVWTGNDPINRVDPDGFEDQSTNDGPTWWDPLRGRRAFLWWAINNPGDAYSAASKVMANHGHYKLAKFTGFVGGAIEGGREAEINFGKKSWNAIIGTPAAIKNSIFRATKFVVIDGGNAVGLVSDETHANESDVYQYAYEQNLQSRIPLWTDAKEFGGRVASGDSDTLQDIALGSFATAAGIKVGAYGTRPVDFKAPLGRTVYSKSAQAQFEQWAGRLEVIIDDTNKAVPERLRAGRVRGAQRLADLKIKPTTKTVRPTIEEMQTWGFRQIVGEPDYTPVRKLPVGVIVDGGGSPVTEIKSGSSILKWYDKENYQLRLMLYQSLKRGDGLILRTTRPLPAEDRAMLQRLGVTVIEEVE